LRKKTRKWEKEEKGWAKEERVKTLHMLLSREGWGERKGERPWGKIETEIGIGWGYGEG